MLGNVKTKNHENQLCWLKEVRVCDVIAHITITSSYSCRLFVFIYNSLYDVTHRSCISDVITRVSSNKCTKVLTTTTTCRRRRQYSDVSVCALSRVTSSNAAPVPFYLEGDDVNRLFLFLFLSC